MSEAGGIKIPPVNMAQTMSIGAMMLFGLIERFLPPDASEEDKVTGTYICLAVFFHQLVSEARHKDKMAGILKAVLVELENPEP